MNKKFGSIFSWILEAKKKLAPIYQNDNDVSFRKCLLLLEYIVGEKNYFNLQKMVVEMKIIEKLNFHLSEIVNLNKPLEYIIGEVNFLGNKIKIEKPLLIPRVETEFLCEFLVKNIKKNNYDEFLFMDLGCGSGCFSIAILNEFKNAKCIATDISEKAIEITKKNSINNFVSDRIYVIDSNFFEKLNFIKFDFIFSNPPYIDIKKFIDKSVCLWEDENALFSKDNGLFHTKKIIIEAINYLNKEGFLFVEIDSEKSYELIDFAYSLNEYKIVKMLYDQYKMPRAILMFLNENPKFQIEENLYESF